jgi:lysophospholipase L1-like esterase
VLALGDSYTLGIGVRDSDAFPARLERALNGMSHGPGASAVEVLNCGVPGYATREARRFFESHRDRFAPDVVLLTVAGNDDRLARDDVPLIVGAPDTRYEFVRMSWNPFDDLLRWLGTRPRRFDVMRDELARMAAVVTTARARLAVVIYRNTPDAYWRGATEAVRAALKGTGTPVLDLGSVLLDGRDWRQLVVHPEYDWHPNAEAHALAAVAIASFLNRTGVVPAAPTSR